MRAAGKRRRAGMAVSRRRSPLCRSGDLSARWRTTSWPEARPADRRIRSDYAMLAQRMIGKGMTNVDWDKHRPEARGMDRLGTGWWAFPPWREARATSTPHRIKYSGRSPRTSIAPARASSWSSTFGTREAPPTRSWRRWCAPRARRRVSRAGRRARRPPLVERSAAPAAAGGRSASPTGIARRAVSDAGEPKRSASASEDRRRRWRGGLDREHESGRSPLFQAGRPRRSMGRCDGPR